MSYSSNFRRRIKRALIKSFGGSCCRCKYSTCIEALDLHHINSDDKRFGFGGGIRKISLYLEEAKKCILLCSNCHREYHYGIWKIDSIKIILFDQDVFLDEIQELKTKFSKYIDKLCVVCNLNKAKKYHKTCGKKCESLLRRKVKLRPSKEELEKLVWEKPTTQIAMEYGVSDKAVDKWCKKENIQKPPRGYWTKRLDKGLVTQPL